MERFDTVEERLQAAEGLDRPVAIAQGEIRNDRIQRETKAVHVLRSMYISPGSLGEVISATAVDTAVVALCSAQGCRSNVLMIEWTRKHDTCTVAFLAGNAFGASEYVHSVSLSRVQLSTVFCMCYADQRAVIVPLLDCTKAGDSI